MLCLSLLCGVTALTAACGEAAPREPDLPQQPDRWVNEVRLDVGSKMQFIGKTKNWVITTATTVREVDGQRTVRVGDEIEGIRVGAIQCSFHWRDASSGGQQYMWRGKWACKAGRSRHEVENAVQDNGQKIFEYLHVSPVRLDG